MRIVSSDSQPPAGPQPGDLDEHGTPFEARPFQHFDTPDGWNDPDDWQPPEDQNDLDWEGNVVELNHENLLITINPAEWDGLPTPEREWLLTNWIPARQLTYLTGAGSAGKSLLGQQLATCVAMGRPFLGVGTTKARALYLTCEDDGEELHRRQKGICNGLGISLPYLDGRLLLSTMMGALGNELATFREDGTMKTSPAWARLLYTIRALKIGFVVLDNVAHLFTGNENIRNQVAAFCGLLNKLASETDCAVLLIGHPNKLGAEYSGSTAWENQVRSRLFLEVPKTDEGTPRDPDARQLSRAKANYARNGETIDFAWHQWAFLTDDQLPKDDLEQPDSETASAADERLFMNFFYQRRAQNRPVSAARNSMNYAPKVFSETAQGRKTGKRRLEQAMERLFETGKISIGQVGEYSKGNPKMGIIETPSFPQSAQSALGENFPKFAQSSFPKFPKVPKVQGASASQSAQSNLPPPLKGGITAGAARGTPAAIEEPGWPENETPDPDGENPPWADDEQSW